ncbi:VanZ family protein [Chungangia koreensis]|uniref:VanZ family protein n=1 Tax=Chungangia koreensis TaxID=752657 RepID=A0ABV8X3U1_9LACT
MIRYIFLLAILIGLFISSSQTYEEQSLIPQLQEWLPNQPLKELLSILEIPYWGKIVSVEERGYYAFVEFLIRKGTHILTFGTLSFAVYLVLPQLRLRFIVAFLITVIFAFLDEYHQSLTGGRTPAIQDVGLDAIGATLALILIYMYNKFKRP